MAGKSTYRLLSDTVNRLAVAKLWHERAKLTRQEIFRGFDARLRPIAAPAQVDVSVPGMVGLAYMQRGIVIVSVNPAGGRDSFQPTAGDDRLYKAATRLRELSDLSAFEELNAAFMAGMPSWGPQWRVINSILSATRRQLAQIAYPYLVPFRSRADSGSTLPETVLERAYASGFAEIIEALSPAYVVAVDRPSERACLRLLREFSLDFELTYYTRKRDAHSDRAATLAALSSKF